MSLIQLKRVYAPTEKSDGFRILVDRLWPRGIKKETANIDVWIKEVAPSADLRKWFNHEPEKWQKFGEEYKAELQKSEAVNELLKYIKQHSTVTLLYASKDEKHNQALILKEFFDEI